YRVRLAELGIVSFPTARQVDVSSHASSLVPVGARSVERPQQRGSLGGLSARFFVGQRRGRGRRRAPPGSDGGGAGAGGLRGRQPVQFDLATDLGLLVQLLEEGNAPAAAGPCSAALRQLTGNTRPLDAQKVEQLPPRDVEAVADFLVEVFVRPFGHHRLPSRSELSSLSGLYPALC